MTLTAPRTVLRALARVALLATVAAGAAACPATTDGVAPKSPELTFVLDESVLEERIAGFLEARGLRVGRQGGPADLWLVLVWDGGERPDFRVTVDTFITSRTDDGRPQERGVLLRLETGLFVTPPEVAGALERLNQHHATNWAGTWYVDREDGQIEATWALNIPREVRAIESGLVHDAVVRMVVSWRELAETLGDRRPGDVL